MADDQSLVELCNQVNIFMNYVAGGESGSDFPIPNRYSIEVRRQSPIQRILPMIPTIGWLFSLGESMK